jgi:hypothetical protein
MPKQTQFKPKTKPFFVPKTAPKTKTNPNLPSEALAKEGKLYPPRPCGGPISPTCFFALFGRNKEKV